MKKETINSGRNENIGYLKREKFFSDHILDNSRSMISIINRDYVYEKVNSTFCNAIRGMSEAIVGKSLGDIWGHDTFRKKIKPNVDRCFSGATVRYEASFSVPQAGKRFFEVIFRPFPVESGRITHLLAETFDITDLKLTEKIAIEKEEELRKFETSLPIGLIRCEPDGKITHANNSFLLITDCNDTAMIYGRNLRNFYSAESLLDLHLEQLQDGIPRNFGRIPLMTCKGTEIVCRLSGFLARDEYNNPSYIDFAIEDSSREIMLEARLLQAQKLETIGALAGGIAHDFNNILATISGYAELLQDDLPRSSPSALSVSKIMMAVSKARSLTDQILTFSRHVEQEKVPVNVNEVLKETIAFMKSSVPPDIGIRRSIGRKEAPVFADPTQLFRVFLNLMTNAIHSMEERKGTISIRLKVVYGKEVQNILNKTIVPDEYVLVTFKDQGRGMDPSVISRIFEPFFTTREVGSGSGLGLSVVHGIVSEMGGDILVSSSRGKGSEFSIYLPVNREIIKDSMVSEKKKKILFIAGNRHEARILSLALGSAGFDLIESSDVKQLSQIYAKKEPDPDLIIFMSDSKQIKAEDLIRLYQDRRLNTPCILISDSDQDLLEENLVNSGIVRQQLIKPVSLKEIKSAIQLSLV